MNLKEENEILKDRVKHLESLVEYLDVTPEGKMLPMSTYNHKTVRNGNGNLITYYTK